MSRSLVELSKAVKIPSKRSTRLNSNKASLKQSRKNMRLAVRR